MMIDQFSAWWNGIAFANPEYFVLWWLVAALVILAATVFFRRHYAAPAKTYGTRHPLVPRSAFWVFLLVITAAMIVALGRPYTKEAARSLRRGNIDIIAVLDTGLSMNANDVRPTRLEIAKRELMGLGTNVLRPGDRIAFFVFGKTSVRKLYLSDDFSAFYSDIQRISFPKNLNHNELVWDTDFSLALRHIYESLDAQDKWLAKNGLAPTFPRERVLFLLSDGDDQVKNNEKITEAIAEFRKRGLRVHPIGIGTTGGVPLLSVLRGYVPGAEYPVDIRKEWAGRSTSLQVRTLERIARETGGSSFFIREGDKSALSFLKNVTDSRRSLLLESTAEISKSQELWRYVLYAALCVLLIAILLY